MHVPKTMTRLSVNLNKIALLRNSRGGTIPSVTDAAQTVIDAGAQGITVHPRPDGRHIRRPDVYDLNEMLSVEFNIEGNPTDDFMDLVLDVKPAQCTLVPDDPDQLTSDHGWDLEKEGARIAPRIAALKAADIRVSLFMNPVPEHMPLAAEAGADRIELYTEAYARAWEDGDYNAVLETYRASARAARAAGLGVNAGHDLDLDNLGSFCGAIPYVAEVSIGHALINDALYGGLAETVRAYLDVLGSNSE